MREVFMCDYCNYISTKDAIVQHEKICERNPDVIAAKTRKHWIMTHCKYHDTAFDDGYYEFDSCHKNGHGYGRFADSCVPCEDCAKFCKRK